MIIPLLFWTLTLIACGYSALAGGRDGRWAALLIVGASLLTLIAGYRDLAWGSVQVGIVLVDTALLIGLYVLVLQSQRWWPIWMAGFHLLAVTAHIAASLSEDFLPRIYFAAATFSAVPVPVAMVIGILLDRRAGAPAQAKAPRYEHEIHRSPG